MRTQCSEAARRSFDISRAPGALTFAGSNRSETSGHGRGALVSSAAARRRFPQARPGSPTNWLRHSTSAGSGYTQLPVIRKGNVRKLAGGSDPAGVEPPAAQSGARSPHSKVARSMRRRCETQLANRDSVFPTDSIRRRSLRRGLSRKQLFASLCREAKFQVSRTAGCTALAGPNRDETSVRGLRRIAAEAPRDWRPPNPSPMNPVPGGTQSFASAAENRQVPTHFPGTSIARPPAYVANFQVSSGW